MELNEFLKQCKDDDVLSFGEQLLKVGKIKQAITEAFKTVIPNQLYEYLKNSPHKIHIIPMRPNFGQANDIWFEEGVKFSILRAGSKGWQQGKIKIKVTLEFEPDKTESPLDEVRQEIINS
ncbi:KGK family protein [Stanieria cyanosphaera PCC 7437]|uniref:KGK family protein n=1 Tax=Stanieria cyanosphaera (strain ATCC 29371 / PCC 7437) TaxID=111780 RepID=K9XPZ2_STAC7|nr:KGK domain-containing protein [Stanieria cyanosphaera]AFZ33747.1 KGK family protein [Stanieria cyanosphaera PCC 7437]